MCLIHECVLHTRWYGSWNFTWILADQSHLRRIQCVRHTFQCVRHTSTPWKESLGDATHGTSIVNAASLCERSFEALITAGSIRLGDDEVCAGENPGVSLGVDLEHGALITSAERL